MAYHPFRHVGLKLLSIGLACLLWFVVGRDQVVERTMRVPLEFLGIEESMEMVGDQPALVDVRVRAASSVLSRVTQGEVVAVLNLHGARPGSRIFHLTPNDVRVPFGVEVTNVTPPTVAIDLERSARRLVPILPALDGEPADGFVAGGIRVDPPEVEVVGPESRLRKVTTATTEPVSIDGARATVRDRVTVGLADSALRLVDPRTVLVTVDIGPAPVEREITGVPVTVRNLDAALQVTSVVPEAVTVVVSGTPETVDGLSVADLVVWVDVAALGRGRHRVDVRGDGGSEFGFVRAEPALVELRLVPR